MSGILEMIIDGIACQKCGAPIMNGGEIIDPPGYPQTCENCEKSNESRKSA